MWSELEKRYPTIEEYYVALVERLQLNFLDHAHAVEELFPLDPACSPADMRAQSNAVLRELQRRDWVALVRKRKHHCQPPELAAFADPLPAGVERRVERVRWGGLWGRATSPSETIAISELSLTDAHVCFLSPSVRGTSPNFSSDDEGYVQLPTVYYREVLADRYRPEQVTWYHYVTTGGFEANRYDLPFDPWQHVSEFRRAQFVWEPTRRKRFLWIRRERVADYFLRRESWRCDQRYGSVPRAIGEAVLWYEDDTLPIVALPDAHRFKEPSWQTQ
uniref:Uncharacterized protein n=1 Tax=mine drainage metagenome TaxID=410659 RepID=E6PJB2_9ZZZZ